MATHSGIDPKKLEIGRRIASARERAGLSQVALAVQIGVTPNAVTQWETGRAIPNSEKFHRVAMALDCDVDWLLTGGDPDETRRAQTKAELEALQLMRKLTPDEQRMALAMLTGAAGRGNKT